MTKRKVLQNRRRKEYAAAVLQSLESRKWFINRIAWDTYTVINKYIGDAEESARQEMGAKLT